MMSPNEARLQLAVIQAEGAECQKRYHQHVEAMKRTELEIATLKTRITAIDEAVAELGKWQSGATVSFSPPSAVASWQAQADKLSAERMQLCRQILTLKSVVASNRMDGLKLAKRLEELRRSQRNLEEVAAGRNPAKGWEGGVYYVIGR
jgi:chromosome segregation ATPase